MTDDSTLDMFDKIYLLIVLATTWWSFALMVLIYKVVIWIKDGIWPVVTLGTTLSLDVSDIIYSTNLKGIQIGLRSIFDASLLTMFLVWLPLITSILVFLVYHIWKAIIEGVGRAKSDL